MHPDGPLGVLPWPSLPPPDPAGAKMCRGLYTEKGWEIVHDTFARSSGLQRGDESSMFAALRSPVVVVDAELEVTAANTAACDLLGRGAGDLRGRPLLSVLEPLDAAGRQTVTQAVHRGEPWDLDAETDGVDGRVRLRLRAGPLAGPAGPGGAVVELVPQVDPGAHTAAALRAELAEAVRGDSIVLHYQPVVRVHDRRPVAAEALVRWEHPTRGLLAPAEFLPAADDDVTSGALGMRVLRQACHAAAGWAREVSSRTPVQVAVNVSARQLLQPGLVAVAREALAVASCPPERLIVEVAEESLLRDPEAAARALGALKDLGVDLAVDDLGTGSSPLSYLRRFPLDIVKIDRSLIAGLGRDADQSAVVASLISMAQAIGVRCIAEGVETADQLSMLRRLGCDLGQGYLFSRPMGSHTAGEWLARALAPRTSPAPRRAGGPASQVVTRALELQTEGASLHTIAARLNVEGHRNSGGRRWHHTSVAQLIAGHLYPDLIR